MCNCSQFKWTMGGCFVGLAALLGVHELRAGEGNAKMQATRVAHIGEDDHSRPSSKHCSLKGGPCHNDSTFCMVATAPIALSFKFPAMHAAQRQAAVRSLHASS